MSAYIIVILSAYWPLRRRYLHIWCSGFIKILWKLVKLLHTRNNFHRHLRFEGFFEILLISHCCETNDGYQITSTIFKRQLWFFRHMNMSITSEKAFGIWLFTRHPFQVKMGWHPVYTMVWYSRSYSTSYKFDLPVGKY